MRTAPGVTADGFVQSRARLSRTKTVPASRWPRIRSGLPIYSLYGGSRTASRAAVDSIDVLLIDLQDIGARYYTLHRTAVQVMRDATRAGKRVIILDRPDPRRRTAVRATCARGRADPDSAFSGSCRWRCGTA